MDTLQRALIEKAGHDFGFEHVVEQTPGSVTMASALHRVRTKVTMVGNGYEVSFQHVSGTLLTELNRDFPTDRFRYFVSGTAELAMLLKRASGLAHSLLDQAQTNYEANGAAGRPRGNEGVGRGARQKQGAGNSFRNRQRSRCWLFSR